MALEKLEGLRWASEIKKGGKVIMNDEIIFPNRVLIEKDDYPENLNEVLSSMELDVISVNANELAIKAGNIKTANIVLLGTLSTLLPFSKEAWIASISKNVPQKTIEENVTAFLLGAQINIKA